MSLHELGGGACHAARPLALLHHPRAPRDELLTLKCVSEIGPELWARPPPTDANYQVPHHHETPATPHPHPLLAHGTLTAPPKICRRCLDRRCHDGNKTLQGASPPSSAAEASLATSSDRDRDGASGGAARVSSCRLPRGDGCFTNINSTSSHQLLS
jgi:hypothetical protein